jgi:hypothetical protein
MPVAVAAMTRSQWRLAGPVVVVVVVVAAAAVVVAVTGGGRG